MAVFHTAGTDYFFICTSICGNGKLIFLRGNSRYNASRKSPMDANQSAYFVQYQTVNTTELSAKSLTNTCGSGDCITRASAAKVFKITLRAVSTLSPYEIAI